MTSREYADQQIKRCFDLCDKIDVLIQKQMNVLHSAKILSDMDSHMVVFEAENIVKEL